MNNFFLLKLNRAIWIALLEQNKIIDAMNCFEIYRNNILNYKAERNEKKEIEKELANSMVIFWDKLMQKGNNYIQSQDYSNALLCFATAFKYDQKNFQCITNYITCLEKLGQYDLEANLLESVGSISDKENAETYKSLAAIYEKMKLYSKSIEFYKKYLNIKGKENTTADEYNQLGCYYNLHYMHESHNKDDIKSGYECFAKASDMNPQSRLFAKNATIMAGKGNYNKESQIFWDRLFEINQMTNDDKYDYAAYSIRIGHFEEWHKYFESRFEKENNKTYLPEIKKPKWNGIKDLSNSTLLIHYEQGFGDTFLMWGYIPRLKDKVKHIIFVVQNGVYELLKDNDFGVEVIPQSQANLDKIKYDYYIPSMSIPRILNVNKDTCSVGEGYIKADSNLVQDYKHKYFNNHKFKIGISLSGNNTGNRTRDISAKAFLQLDKLNNVEIYCLTKGINDDNFSEFKNNKVINIAKKFNHFGDTAAAIENCDIIISADNCILNLAGAMGKKTFGVFNWTYEFRWYKFIEENPQDVGWYTSVKPYICDDIDHWEKPIERIIRDIKPLLK